MPLPSGVQTEQILKAVKALLKHIEKQNAKANSLIEEDELIYLVRACCLLQTSEVLKGCTVLMACSLLLQQVSLKKTPQHTRKDKPLRM